MQREQVWAWVAFATVCVVWGTTYLAIAIALETIPPLLLTGTRFTAAGLIMLALAAARGERVPRDLKSLANLALRLLSLLLLGWSATGWLAVDRRDLACLDESLQTA